MGQLPPVGHQADKHLPGHRTPADIDMPQETGVGGLIIDGDAELVNMVDHRVLHLVRLLGEDQTAGIFHHLMRPRPEESGIHPPLLLATGYWALLR